MRISDWSSDVCSSDLAQADEFLVADGRASDDVRHPPGKTNTIGEQGRTAIEAIALPDHRVDGEARPIKLIFKAISNAGAVFEPKIGRASCRERVCPYV